MFLLTKRCTLLSVDVFILARCVYGVVLGEDWSLAFVLGLLHSAIDCFRRARFASCLYGSTLLGRQIDLRCMNCLVHGVVFGASGVEICLDVVEHTAR